MTHPDWQRAGTAEGEAIPGTPIVVTAGDYSTSQRCTRCDADVRFGLPMTNGMVRELEFFTRHAECSVAAHAVHPAYDRLQEAIDDFRDDNVRRPDVREAIRAFAQAAAELGILRGARLERERANYSGTGEAQGIAKQLLGEAP